MIEFRGVHKLPRRQNNLVNLIYNLQVLLSSQLGAEVTLLLYAAAYDSRISTHGANQPEDNSVTRIAEKDSSSWCTVR